MSAQQVPALLIKHLDYNHSCLFLTVCAQRSVYGKHVYLRSVTKLDVSRTCVFEFCLCRNQFVPAVHVAVLIRSLSATAVVCSEGLKLKVQKGPTRMGVLRFAVCFTFGSLFA